MSLDGSRLPIVSAGLLLILVSDLPAQTGFSGDNYRRTAAIPAARVGIAEPILRFDDPVDLARESNSILIQEDPQSPSVLSQDPQSADSLAPLQSRKLTLRVQAVSIANESIGTGLIPEPASPAWSEEEILVDLNRRGQVFTQVYWLASMIQHHPLYFEDPMLERHGHAKHFAGMECCQSIVSGAKFFGTIFMMPYLRTLQPKHDCVYALGSYRVGSGAPCLKSKIPYDKRAAIVESASAAAFFWAIPL
jgi:hypothetical protein